MAQQGILRPLFQYVLIPACNVGTVNLGELQGKLDDAGKAGFQFVVTLSQPDGDTVLVLSRPIAVEVIGGGLVG